MDRNKDKENGLDKLWEKEKAKQKQKQGYAHSWVVFVGYVWFQLVWLGDIRGRKVVVLLLLSLCVASLASASQVSLRIPSTTTTSSNE